MKQQPNKRKENTPKVEMKRIKLPINWIGMLQDMHAQASVNGIKKRKKTGDPLPLDQQQSSYDIDIILLEYM